MFARLSEKCWPRVQSATQLKNWPLSLQYIRKGPRWKAPWDYKPQPQVISLLAGSSIDRFAIMDTYYFTLSRFYDTLDWHVAHIPAAKLGVGMMNRADINTDGWVARFHALHTKLCAEPNNITVSAHALRRFFNFLKALSEIVVHGTSQCSTSSSCR